ncbi:MAG: hypothetical protein RR646_06450 [Erysipelotrichaceae bacterium]
MKFKNSFNVKYDMLNTNAFDDYFPTSAHAPLLKALLKGRSNASELRAHISFGAYGTGKSFISTLSALLFSNSAKKSQISKLANDFESVDEELSELIRSTDYKKNKSIIISLNGNEGRFEEILRNKMRTAIIENKLKINFPGIENDIISAIDNWKSYYEDTFIKLEENIQHQYNLNIKEFCNGIIEGNNDYINYFQEVYPLLSSGAHFTLSNNYNITSLLECILPQLQAKKLGLFVIYDEFGRYLDGLEEQEIGSFMETMQNLAELANSGAKNLDLLFVAHKPLSHYFRNCNYSVKSEFEKIEKRFGIYEIKNDYSTFITIASKIIKENKVLPTTEYVKIQKEELSKFKIFDGLLSDEIVNKLIIKDCFPLHPVTLFMLPLISSKFGQNERTLFTFLTEINFNDKEEILVTKLADYFFIGKDHNNLEAREYNIFLSNLQTIENMRDDADSHILLSIYKVIFLWTLTNANARIKLNERLIAYVINVEFETVKKLLGVLIDAKIIRFNTIKKVYELLEIAPVDLDKLVNKKLASIELSDSEFLNIITNNNLKCHYVYSDKFNNEYDMIRFAAVSFSKGQVFVENEECDYSININLDGDISNENYDLNGCLNYDIDCLLTLVKKIKAIDMLISENNIIGIYKNVKSDLIYEKKIVLKEFDNFYDSIFSEKCVFKIDGKKNSFGSFRALEVFVNDCITSKFNRTVRIHNDQVNMFKIVTTQFNAVLKILNVMLNGGKEQLRNIEGLGPDKLLSVCIENANYDEAKNEIYAYIGSNTSGDLYDLYSILINEPYGMRPYIAMIVLMDILSPKIDSMMFSSANNYIASLPIEEYVECLLNKKKHLQYTYNVFEYENTEFLNSLMELFPSVNEQVKKKSPTIRLCDGMYSWLLNLPLVIQQKELLSVVEQSFITTINKMKNDPMIQIRELKDYYAIDDIFDLKKKIESTFEIFYDSYNDSTLRKLGINDKNEWISNLSKIQLKNNRLAFAIYNSINLIDYYKDDIEKLDIKRWPISSYNLLYKEISDDFKRTANKLKTEKIVINGIEKEVEEIQLSKKAVYMLDNIKATIDANAKYLTQVEVEKAVIELVNLYIK